MEMQDETKHAEKGSVQTWGEKVDKREEASACRAEEQWSTILGAKRAAGDTVEMKQRLASGVLDVSGKRAKPGVNRVWRPSRLVQPSRLHSLAEDVVPWLRAALVILLAAAIFTSLVAMSEYP